MWPFKRTTPTITPLPATALLTHAWAIDSRSGEGHVLLGVFWFHPGAVLKSCQDGMRTALFRTRDQARETMECYEVKKTFPKARVVRVDVVITW